jgi:branched-chain amino acid transport system permease protein
MSIAEAYSSGKTFVFENPLSMAVGVGITLLVADLVIKVTRGSLPVFDLALYVKDSLVLGMVVGLAGIGLSMTYSILNFANFAHGDYLTAGAFAGWAVTYLIAGFGTVAAADLVLIGVSGDASASDVGASVAATPLAILAGLVAAIVATIALALLVDRVVYRRMRDEENISLLFASIGIALMLRYAIVFVFGTRSSSLTVSASPEFTVPGVGLQVTTHELTLLVCTVLLMGGVHYMLQYTKLGTAMRAMADNRDLAAVTGIPTERIIRTTWIIGGGLTGAAGYLVTLETALVQFNTGWSLLLLIFAAVILGGIGSMYGAMFGGLTIGFASNVSLVWIPADFSTAAAFIVMIVVLLVKPEGLFSGVTTA